MPVRSLYPPVQIPNVNLFTFLFERKEKPYADEKSERPLPLIQYIEIDSALIFTFQDFSRTLKLTVPTHTRL